MATDPTPSPTPSTAAPAVAAPDPARSGAAGVTDDSELFARWRGPDAPGHVLVLGAVSPGERPLDPEVSVLFKTVDEEAVRLVRGLGWSAVERCCIVLLRGVARHPRSLELFDALAEVGLQPSAVSRRHLDVFDGVELELTRPRGAGLSALALADTLAGLARSLLTARNEAPRIALAGMDAAWTDGFDNVHATDPRWRDDHSLLREASPTVALVRHDHLGGPLAGALAAVREFGGRIVSDRPPTGDVEVEPEATIEDLPLPVPRRAFADHRLYSGAGDTTVRPPGADELADPAGLLALAAAGVPLAGAAESEVDGHVVGPTLAALLCRSRGELDGSPNAIDLHQVRLRRAAFDHAATPSVWERIGQRLDAPVLRSPRVFVVAVAGSRRGAARLLGDYEAQRYGPRGIVLLGPRPQEPPGGSGAGEVPVCERASVAEVLQLARGAGADLVTFFEEGVRYGPEHLGDLARARWLSDADVVLRPTEFVVDPARGELRRRPVGPVEAPTRDPEALALAAYTDDLAYLAQDVEARTLTSTAVSEALLDRGAQAYRTHGFGLAVIGSSGIGGSGSSGTADAGEPAHEDALALHDLDLNDLDLQAPDLSDPTR